MFLALLAVDRSSRVFPEGIRKEIKRAEIWWFLRQPVRRLGSCPELRLAVMVDKARW